MIIIIKVSPTLGILGLESSPPLPKQHLGASREEQRGFYEDCAVCLADICTRYEDASAKKGNVCGLPVVMCDRVIEAAQVRVGSRDEG
jgi:hypothetical protein